VVPVDAGVSTNDEILYATTTNEKSNLLSVEKFSSSENSGLFKLHSKSRVLLAADIDRMKGLCVSFKLKDQGWGNRKGRVVIKVMNGSDELLYQIEDWTVASHEWDLIDEAYDEDHYPLKNLVEGCHFELWYSVGAGGGHELYVENFNIDIMSIEGNKFYYAMIKIS